MLYREMESKVKEQGASLEQKANKNDVAKISSGTPLFASNIIGMTDTTKNYVNTSDGYLYVYSDGIWNKTNVQYQTTGIEDNSIMKGKFIKNINENLFLENLLYGSSEIDNTNIFTNDASYLNATNENGMLKIVTSSSSAGGKCAGVKIKNIFKNEELIVTFEVKSNISKSNVSFWIGEFSEATSTATNPSVVTPTINITTSWTTVQIKVAPNKNIFNANGKFPLLCFSRTSLDSNQTIYIKNMVINNSTDKLKNIIEKNDRNNLVVCSNTINSYVVGNAYSSNTIDYLGEYIRFTKKEQANTPRSGFVLWNVQKDNEYIIKFKAKSNIDNTLNLFIYKNLANIVYDYSSISLSNEFKEYTFGLKTKESDENVTLTFDRLGLGFSLNDLKNIEDYVEFKEVEVYEKEYYDNVKLRVKSENLEDNSVTIKKLSSEVLSLINNKNTSEFKPRAVILDTDWWTDSDDAVSIRILNWAEQQGMVDLVGICLDAIRDTSVKSLSTFLDYEGRSGLCLGADKEAIDYNGTPPYHQTILDSWKYCDYSSVNELEDCVEYYRRALTSLPDGEQVDIICIGYGNALSRLLNSSADKYSELNGVELVKTKVRHLWFMAGQYLTSDGGLTYKGAENNFTRTVRSRQAGKNICDNWSTPITFLGWEVSNEIRTGGTVGTTIGTYDLLYKILLAHGGTDEATNGRSSWDPMTMLLACINDDNASGYNYVYGANIVDEATGNNTFTVSPNGKHRFVIKKYPNDWYKYQINSILEKKAWKYRQLGRVQLEKV